MAYGQHQSFYLRDKWISKGLKSVVVDGDFFSDKDAFEKIGLGKNMLQSLKFWLTASNLITQNTDRGFELTELGQTIFENDRLILKQSTAAIIHYNLVKNKDDRATVFNWFFNQYNETVFTREIVEQDFFNFVGKKEAKLVSEKTLKRDTDCLIQLYTKQMDESDPEDVIFSPVSKLKLVSESKKAVMKVSGRIENIGITALYYSLIKFTEENDIKVVSVDEILGDEMLWGKVYNMNRAEVVEALKELSIHPTYPITFVRTNNLDCVQIPNKISSEGFLKEEFSNGDVT